MVDARAEFQPELWVRDGPAAVAFYERALGAVVEHRVDGPGAADLIAQLRVAGARFWVSTASESMRRFSPDMIDGATGRLLLVVDDPPGLGVGALRDGRRGDRAVARREVVQVAGHDAALDATATGAQGAGRRGGRCWGGGGHRGSCREGEGLVRRRSNYSSGSMDVKLRRRRRRALVGLPPEA
jgi:catechol 2,3-dioxygenase-like lactoylglutathione lyase family enzyme